MEIASFERMRRTTRSSSSSWTSRAKLYAVILAGAFVVYTYSHTQVMQYFKMDKNADSLLLWFDSVAATPNAATTTHTVKHSPIINSNNETIPPPPPPPPLQQNETTRKSRVVHSSRNSGSEYKDSPSFHLMADLIHNGQTGSYWLPRPPFPNDLIDGYELREQGTNNSRALHKVYGNRTGFVAKDHVNIVMYDGVWHPDFDGYNAGDFIAYFLSPLIAGRPPLMTGLDKGLTRKAAKGGLAVVGSILHFGPRYSWGPGMIEYPQSPLRASTETIFAMRGPKSYRQMKRQEKAGGRFIPNVVGDLGSFMSWFYQPYDQVKRYELCIIPHYIDKNAPFITRLQKQVTAAMNTTSDHYKLAVLDISGPITSLMDEICKCHFVLSSSLHGIIFADSYNIPNAHVELSTKVYGKGHKFDDYYESVNRTRHVLNGRGDDVATATSTTTILSGKAKQLQKQQQQAAAGGTNWTLAQVQAWVQHQQNLYNSKPPRLDHLLSFWKACPMHAVAYHGMTRHDQETFGQIWAANFDYYMHNRPATMLQLEMAMNRAFLNVSLRLEFDPRPK